jgi:CHAT domain-containing protein
VQTLEHGQSMMLAKTLTGKAAAAELARGGRADLADRYQALTGRLAALSRAAAAPARTPTILDETRLAGALDTARADLDALIREIREQPGYERFLGGISFAEIRALAAESAIAYCAATVHGGLALLLAPGGPDVTPWFFDVSYDDLRALLVDTGPDGHTSGFLAGVLGDSAALAAALPSVLTVMRSAVGRPLAQALATRPGGECVIIPVGPMRLVPLHAALRGTDDEPCTPSAEITVSYAPSALSLRWAREKANALGLAAGQAAHGFLGVADPTGRLRYAGLEVARAARAFEEGGSTVVTGPAVRSGQVLTSLAGATYAHFACHGVYSAQDPGYSGIVLGGGDRLTVSDLRRSGALNARLVVASACQTAVTDVARLPDEAIGLPTALLEAGAAGVIGTLWPVPDLPAALLLSQYYDFLFPPAGGTAPAPAAALAAAQVWLAGLAAGELGRYLDDLLTAATILPDQQAPALTALVAKAKASLALGYEATDRPFADPACWAAFVLVGA